MSHTLNQIKVLGGMAYVASPYTKFETGLDQAHMEVCEVAARLVAHGVCVHCPVAESHSIAYYGDLNPLDSRMWTEAHLPALKVSSCLIVAKMKGWHRSVGIAHEINCAEEWGLPIFFINPQTLEISETP